MAYAVTLGGFSLLLLMYLLDFSYWGGFIGATLRRLGISVVVACIVASCLLLAKAYPSMPMALFVLGLPLYMWLIRKTVFAHNSIASFFYTASGCTAIASCIALGIWIAWLLSPPGYLYNAETKRIFNRLMHCDEDDARVPICLAAFMLWISPLVNAGICLVLALVTFLLARSTSNAKKSSQIAIKIGGAVLVLCAIGIYLAASIQGANMKATNALYPFMAAGVVVLFVAISSAVGWDSMKQNIFSIPLVKRMREFASFSFARSLITMLAAPFFGVFIVLSVMNQAVRKYLACCGCTKGLDDDERKRCLTTVAHHQWTLLMTWKAAEVLYYTLIWQVVGWALIVGSKLTYLIFAMLIKACMVAGLGIGPVTGIFVPTGVVMFLLPPVPGTPVYLAGGILLTRIAEPEFGSFIDGDRCQEIRAPCLDGGAPDANGTCASGETWADRSTGNYEGCDGGFWLGLLYAVCICFILKLFSSALQQKLIGERLGYRVGVRSMIGINSDLVKAIRHILMQPGMKRDKVMCLCGGPDWPTSVTAGILGCKLGRTLYGTLPVMIIVATSAMAGAFLYAKEKGGVYSSLADVVVMIGLMAQLVFMAGAMYYIEDLVQNRPEIIAAMPDDEEVSARRRAAPPPPPAPSAAHFSPPSPSRLPRQVAKLDAEQAALSKCQADVTAWQRVPTWMRIVLVTSSMLGTLSCYMIFVASSYAFADFTIVDDPATVLCLFEQRMDEAEWAAVGSGPPPVTCTPLVSMPIGWLGVAALLYVCIAMSLFSSWRKRAALAEYKQRKKSGVSPGGAAAPGGPITQCSSGIHGEAKI